MATESHLFSFVKRQLKSPVDIQLIGYGISLLVTYILIAADERSVQVMNYFEDSTIKVRKGRTMDVHIGCTCAIE